MSAILRAQDLTSAELGDLLGQLAFPAGTPARAWLEAADGWALAYWPGVDGRVPWCRAGWPPEDKPIGGLLERLTGGRIFAPAGELRWRSLPALGARSCRTTYLGADLPAVAGLEPRPELEGLKPRTDEVPLWGLLTAATRGGGGEPDEWIELRVPHRFCYPVEPPDPTWQRAGVKAVIESWHDRRGDCHFLRLCGLHAYPGE